MKVRFLIAASLLAAALSFSCSDPESYLRVGSNDRLREMDELLRLMHSEKEAGENRFILIQQIANNLASSGFRDRLNVFLTTYVEKNPKDQFNAYYLWIVAQNYRSQKAFPFVAYYYERILKDHPDVMVRGRSIHLQCLQELTKLKEKPEYRIVYYKELIARFRDQIDLGTTYFYLAKTYESLGEWEQAIQAYNKFLKYPDKVIPEFPDAHRAVANMLAFYNSDKNWTMENLDDLVKAIKKAIDDQNVRALLRLRAGANFFAMSWDQEDSEDNTNVAFDLGIFLRQSRVSYADQLDLESNAKEAYLSTWGWTYRIPRWFLYFKKVHYPLNPEINGRWEWAGIYFGEKL
jgi:tetratricopeptide (TPR) repeat protein